MTRTTNLTRNGQNFGQTMRQGLQALGGRDVPSYTLLFLDPARNKMKGEYTQVLIPYAELGRGSQCTIRYGEDYPTVSRLHASIQTSGGQTILTHHGSNPTLVNGRPVQGSVALQNGDEIQLSYEGPRLRFNIAQTGTSSMKFTQRLALYTSQALVPYKRAMWSLSAVLVCALGFLLYQGNSMAGIIKGQGATITSLRDTLDSLLTNIPSPQPPVSEAATQGPRPASGTAAQFFENNKEDIYLIWVKQFMVIYPGDEPKIYDEIKWAGTGFLTTDGRFVTARHVIKPWKYETDEMHSTINASEMKGAKIQVKFIAFSPSGDKFEFTSDDMRDTDSKDELFDFNGMTVSSAVNTSETDWAYMRTSGRKGVFDPDLGLSKTLKAGTEIYVSGYQYFNFTHDPDKGLTPNYSRTDVAQNGLSQGVIQVTNPNFGPGTSGGPVIARVGGKFKLVGIAVAGVGFQQGFIVPVCNLQ